MDCMVRCMQVLNVSNLFRLNFRTIVTPCFLLFLARFILTHFSLMSPTDSVPWLTVVGAEDVVMEEGTAMGEVLLRTVFILCVLREQ